MSISFAQLADFSFSTAFVFAVSNGQCAELTPDHLDELKKCVALFDQAPVLYTSTKEVTPEQVSSADAVIETMSRIARTSSDKNFSQTAAALLQALALKGYPLAQWEYARYLEKQEPHKTNHSRIYYSLLKLNKFAPKEMKDKIPSGMCLKSELTEEDRQDLPDSNCPLEESWKQSEHQRWWDAAQMPTITGVRSPAEFMNGEGDPAALPYIAELMLGTYNIPVTKCVEDQYLQDIYKTQEDKEAFYNTISNYKLPRLPWASRIAPPLVGWLGRLGLASDFVSEGHRMCAVADVILMLLGKDLRSAKKGSNKPFSFPALARDTIEKMAKNGFPNAQALMACYLFHRGIEKDNQEDIDAARGYAEQVVKNPYATPTEIRWAKTLNKELTQEEIRAIKANAASREQSAKTQTKQKSAQKEAANLKRATPVKMPTSTKKRVKAPDHQR